MILVYQLYRLIDSNLLYVHHSKELIMYVVVFVIVASCHRLPLITIKGKSSDYYFKQRYYNEVRTVYNTRKNNKVCPLQLYGVQLRPSMVLHSYCYCVFAYTEIALG